MMHALAVLLCLAVHDEKLSVSRVEVNPDGVVWTADVALQGLEKILKFPADPLDLSERQLQGMKAEIVAYLRTCIKAEINGALVEPEAGELLAGGEEQPRAKADTLVLRLDVQLVDLAFLH